MSWRTTFRVVSIGIVAAAQLLAPPRAEASSTGWCNLPTTFHNCWDYWAVRNWCAAICPGNQGSVCIDGYVICVKDVW